MICSIIFCFSMESNSLGMGKKNKNSIKKEEKMHNISPNKSSCFPTSNRFSINSPLFLSKDPYCLYIHIFEVLCVPIILQTVAEMAAIGFGLPRDAFTSLMKQVMTVFLS